MQNPDTASHFPDMEAQDLGSREQLYKGKFLHYQQAETNTSIREGWFYRDDTRQKVRSTDDVFDIYERAVGGNSTFLLNIPRRCQGIEGNRRKDQGDVRHGLTEECQWTEGGSGRGCRDLHPIS